MIPCLTWDWEIAETSSLKASYSANNYTRATRISLSISVSLLLLRAVLLLRAQ